MSDFCPITPAFKKINSWVKPTDDQPKVGFGKKHCLSRIITPLVVIILGGTAFIYHAGSFVLKAPITLCKYTICMLIPAKVNGKWSVLAFLFPASLGAKALCVHGLKATAFAVEVVAGPVIGFISPAFLIRLNEMLKLVNLRNEKLPPAITANTGDSTHTNDQNNSADDTTVATGSAVSQDSVQLTVDDNDNNSSTDNTPNSSQQPEDMTVTVDVTATPLAPPAPPTPPAPPALPTGNVNAGNTQPTSDRNNLLAQIRKNPNKLRTIQAKPTAPAAAVGRVVETNRTTPSVTKAKDPIVPAVAQPEAEPVVSSPAADTSKETSQLDNEVKARGVDLFAQIRLNQTQLRTVEQQTKEHAKAVVKDAAKEQINKQSGSNDASADNSETGDVENVETVVSPAANDSVEKISPRDVVKSVQTNVFAELLAGEKKLRRVTVDPTKRKVSRSPIEADIKKRRTHIDAHEDDVDNEDDESDDDFGPETTPVSAGSLPKSISMTPGLSRKFSSPVILPASSACVIQDARKITRMIPGNVSVDQPNVGNSSDIDSSFSSAGSSPKDPSSTQASPKGEASQNARSNLLNDIRKGKALNSPKTDDENVRLSPKASTPAEALQNRIVAYVVAREASGTSLEVDSNDSKDVNSEDDNKRWD